MGTWSFRITEEGMEPSESFLVELTDTQSLLHLHEILSEAWGRSQKASWSIFASGRRDDPESEHGDMKDRPPNLASRALLRQLGLETGRRMLHLTRVGSGIWHRIDVAGRSERSDETRYPRILGRAAPGSEDVAYVTVASPEPEPARPPGIEPCGETPPPVASSSPTERGETRGVSSPTPEEAPQETNEAARAGPQTDEPGDPHPPPSFERGQAPAAAFAERPAPAPAATPPAPPRPEDSVAESWLPGLGDAARLPPRGGTSFDGAAVPRPSRNDPCPCGSGRKYKKCCLGKGR